MAQLITPSTQFEYNSTSVSTNTQVQKNAVTKGDLICVAVMWVGSGMTLSLTDTVGTTYGTADVSMSDTLNIGGITPWQMTIFHGKAAGNAAANGNTVTLTWTGGTTPHYVINILEFRGVDTLDQTGSSDGTSANGIINITPAHAGEIVVGFGSSGSFGDFTGGLVEQDGPDTGGPASFFYSAWGSYPFLAGGQSPEIQNNASQPWNLIVATYYKSQSASSGLVYADMVEETTTTTGTGTITLGGAATGFRAFSTAFQDGQLVTYSITDGTNWETGIGQFHSGPDTLDRNVVLASSNSGALVNFSAGSKTVWCDQDAPTVCDRAVALALQMHLASQ